MRIVSILLATTVLACNTPEATQTEAIQDNRETAALTPKAEMKLTTLEYEEQPTQAELAEVNVVNNEEALKNNVQGLQSGLEVKGSLDKDVIRRVIRRAMPKIKFCYEASLEKSPNLAGKIVVDFTIGLDGKVTNSKPTSGIQPEVDDCVAKSIARLSFPVPQGDTEVRVVYPFIFEPSTK
jgi:outer membrane biosynthesis protein TonB